MKINKQTLRKIIAEEVNESLRADATHDIPSELLDLPTVVKMVKALQKRIESLESRIGE